MKIYELLNEAFACLFQKLMIASEMRMIKDNRCEIFRSIGQDQFTASAYSWEWFNVWISHLYIVIEGFKKTLPGNIKKRLRQQFTTKNGSSGSLESFIKNCRDTTFHPMFEFKEKRRCDV